MCAEEIFHKSREVETLAYELARIAGDKDQEIASLAAKIKSGELKVKSYFDFANEDEYREYVGLNK